MICSIDPLASSAGLDVLEEGGTAADAAIATNAVLAVTAQDMCGLGGDLLALVHGPGRPPAGLVATGRAGSGADPDRLRREGADRMPPVGDVRSVTIPGCVDGWQLLSERFGRLSLGRVLEPAIRVARDGFPASSRLARLAPLIAGVDGAGDFAGLEAGTTVRRPGVARCLEAIADGGRNGFYGGAFGEGLVRIGGGEYRADDLERSQADWVEPLGLDVWGHRLWTAPPGSQGYLVLAAARIAEGLDLPADPSDPRWPHLLVEAVRQASHDRLDVLHDGADGSALLATARLEERRGRISPDRASSPSRSGPRSGTRPTSAPSTRQARGSRSSSRTGSPSGPGSRSPSSGSSSTGGGSGSPSGRATRPSTPPDGGPRPPCHRSSSSRPTASCRPCSGPWAETLNPRSCSSCWPASTRARALPRRRRSAPPAGCSRARSTPRASTLGLTPRTWPSPSSAGCRTHGSRG